jgi:ADP-heptose:LPS heptosyltransferase
VFGNTEKIIINMSDYKGSTQRLVIRAYITVKRTVIYAIKVILFGAEKTLEEPGQLIILKAGGLGDFTFGIPAINFLKNRFPQSRKVLITATTFNDLSLTKTASRTNQTDLPWVKLVKHAVDRVMCLQDLHPTTIRAIRAELKTGEYSTIVILCYPGQRLPSIIQRLFLARLLVPGRARCLGVNKKADYALFRKEQGAWNIIKHKMLGDLDSAAETERGLEITEEDISFEVHLDDADLAPEPVGQLILIAPIATRSHKQWPIDKMRQLINNIQNIFPNAHIAYIGLESHFDTVQKHLQEGRVKTRNLCGRLTVDQIASLMTNAMAYIGNDGGMSQLAGVVGCPSIVIFNGIEEPGMTHPWNSRNGIVYPTIECSPCYNEIACPLGHRRCVEDIPVQTVLDKLMSIIRSNQKSRLIE